MNAREICERKGYSVGTELVCYSVARESDIRLIGNLRMRITAIGDEAILARSQWSAEKGWDDERIITGDSFAHTYRPEGDTE